MSKIIYNTSDYPFLEAIQLALGLKGEDLSKLHEVVPVDLERISTNDQDSELHRMYYENFDKHIKELYLDFVNVHVKSYFGFNECVFQQVPTFRVHRVGNLAVNEWHKDKDYNHGMEEINCWLPVTSAYGTNTIWIESEEDKGDYRPLDCEYGEVLVFDGANLHHGNKTNEEPDTRVSFDFRVVDTAKFKDRGLKTVNVGKAFSIGDYFSVM